MKYYYLFFLCSVLCLASCSELKTSTKSHYRVASIYFNDEQQDLKNLLLLQDIGLNDDKVSDFWSVYPYSPIKGFEYEEGYEYVLLLRKTEGTNLDKTIQDGDWISFTCLKVLSKEKKDSQINLEQIHILWH